MLLKILAYGFLLRVYQLKVFFWSWFWRF
jgi:hypothetical protein